MTASDQRPVKSTIAARRFSLEEFKLELRRIEWPTRRLVLQSSGAVILIMVAFSLAVGALDLGATKLIGLLQFGK